MSPGEREALAQILLQGGTWSADECHRVLVAFTVITHERDALAASLEKTLEILGQVESERDSILARAARVETA